MNSQGTPARQFATGFVSGFGSAFLQFAFERLATLGAFTWKEIGLIWNVEEELRKLHRTFLKVQDLVDHVESSPLRFNGGNKAWQILFEDLQKLSYDVDALLDHIWLHLSMIQQRDEQPHQQSASVSVDPKNRVFSMILKSGQLDVPHEINQMQEKLDALAEEMKNLLYIEQVKMGIRKCNAMDRSWFSSDCSDNSSLLFDEQTIVGRQRDKENVINLLRENDGALSVIPLVAMGGMGKTILAQLVYNSQEVCDNFKHKIWVSVSADFDIKRITKSIIESITKETCHVSNLDLLQCKLKQLLSEEKFLLVLDDYWNENINDWELLSRPFRYRQGSKVIVTTRSSIVSSIVGSVEAYNPQALSDDECWILMKQRALLQKEESEIFESLGKDIAKKCKGLPLAAKTLGSVLYHKSTHYEWLCIANNELWDLPRDENGILPSLMLSYLHLPAPLQKCFAYCSLFPLDHEFAVEELVLFWMAEGFIQPQGERRLEDIGKDYFNNLRMRSFFHPGNSSSNSHIYKMHNLFHDLARLISTNTCSQVKYDERNPYPLFGNACHLSLHHQTIQPLELSSSLENKRLRTFMVVCKGSPSGKIDRELFSKLKYLRTLYLCNIGLLELPDSIGHLIYLRCLNLCGNCIDKLPESMCELTALQTLMLCKCLDLLELPTDMKKVSNLRHLMFDIGSKLTSMPREFGKLTNLQTLSAFIVSTKGSGIEALGGMNLLTGSLCIKNIHKVPNEIHASRAQIKMKKYLNKLELQWELINGNPRAIHRQEEVLNNLEPHENLKELEIINYCGSTCPGWLSDPQHKFTRIHLQQLDYCDALPSLGKLPFLKSLHIGDMEILKCINESFYGDANGEKFPSLVCLEVFRIPGLEEWREPNVGEYMPRLTTLTIEGCPNLLRLPTRLDSILRGNN